MTVRFKCQSEYQRSYRSRSVSPQRCALLAGLRSDHMGISREPCLQRRKKVILAHFCGPPHQTFTGRGFDENLSSGPAALPVTEREAPPGPQQAGGPSEKPVDICEDPAKSDQFMTKSQKSSRNSPALPSQQQSPINDDSLRKKDGLSSRGQQSILHKTEYSRQFNVKQASAAPSPILTAHQVHYSSHSSVPPFKKKSVAMDTEYQRSFQASAPRTCTRLRKNQEHEKTPLFYTLVKRKNKNLFKKIPEPGLENEINDRSTSSPKPGSLSHTPTKLKKHRFCEIPEEDDVSASHTPQIKELRQQALSYRRRAWGTNFSRDHLSQLLSEHNALWEPTETSDSTSDCPLSTHLDLCQVSSVQAESGRSSCVEALDLASNSGRCSKRSSAVDSNDGENIQSNKITDTNATPPQTQQSALVEDQLPIEEQEKSHVEVPTPKLKMLPIQRTHLDLTTPARGGAILVGKLKDTDKATQRPDTAVSGSVHIPLKPREAWIPDSTQHKPSTSPVSKPAPSQSSALALTAPLHCIQGTLRHADFQHNGELGLRFKEQNCTSGCCGSDEDDRLSVMSWRSAASCSLASAVLERAQKRRDNFWGKT